MQYAPIDGTAGEIGLPPAWHALYTRHQHEKVVHQILTSKGFESFLPLYQTARRWKDRTKVLSLPLFPCYVFLKGPLDRRLEIVTTPGIHAFVLSSGQPASIPQNEIDAIRRAVESGARVEPHPLLRCGEWVRVKAGPLAGVQGILVRKRNLYRLVLSIEMLGKAAAVELDAWLVEPLGRNQPCGMRIRGSSAISEPLPSRNSDCRHFVSG